jgi:hypothetical protein
MEVCAAGDVVAGVAVGCSASAGAALCAGGVVEGVTGGVSESMESCWGVVCVGSGGSVWRFTGTGLGTELVVGSEPAKTGMTTGVASGLGGVPASWGLFWGPLGSA